MPTSKNGTNSGAELAELRRRITSLVADNAVAMVQRAIDSVTEEGQYQAIKYLFEMIGLYPAVAGEDDKPEDTLSQILLRQLGITTDTEDQEHAAGEIDRNPVK